VADGYEQLALTLAQRRHTAHRPSGHRILATTHAPVRVLPVPRPAAPEEATVLQVPGAQQ
jgi:hypothetical protein